MMYNEIERINLLVLIGLYPYRTVVEDFSEYIGEINLGSLTEKCKKYNINKKIAVEWCEYNGVDSDNYFGFIEPYVKPLSRFEKIKERTGEDFERFRWDYASVDTWSIMERYSIDMVDFKFLCKKFGCKGRRKYDEKNGKAIVLGYYKLDEKEFEDRFGIKKDHKVVKRFVKAHREKKRLYQKKYRKKLDGGGGV